MNIVQITPGAGKMYCGNCFRDNALVASLRKLGHSVTMVPLYLPMTLDEVSQHGTTPIFFSGINVYLGQKSELYRKAPRWLHNVLASPKLLEIAAVQAGKTRAEELGDITLSMLRGEQGNQVRELNELITWLKTSERPEIISLSNVLLVGMARKLKQELGVPIICSLQGEDSFLDGLSTEFRELAWQVTSERALDVDYFIAPSRYFAELMSRRLKIPQEKIRIVHNGINLDGFKGSSAKPSTPTLGYFARMCPEKGLHLLVDAFVELKKRGQTNLKLKVGGSCGPADEPFVQEQREKLMRAGALEQVEFFPNLNREEKITFLNSLTVFSVPAMYGEAFGLYLIEAMAAGIPAVQPEHAAFPELLELTGGGVLVAPTSSALADGIESLLLNPMRAQELGETGRHRVAEMLNAQKMAENFAKVCAHAVAQFPMANRK
jgi:glycosyltransferase involved in cell wall biosynthesis